MADEEEKKAEGEKAKAQDDVGSEGGEAAPKEADKKAESNDGETPKKKSSSKTGKKPQKSKSKTKKAKSATGKPKSKPKSKPKKVKSSSKSKSKSKSKTAVKPTPAEQPPPPAAEADAAPAKGEGEDGKSGDAAATPAPAPAPAPAAPASRPDGVKMTVKSHKNQFAMTRLVLMLMDVQPDALTVETIADLKTVYALLVSVHSNYGGANSAEAKATTAAPDAAE